MVPREIFEVSAVCCNVYPSFLNDTTIFFTSGDNSFFSLTCSITKQYLQIKPIVAINHLLKWTTIINHNFHSNLETTSSSTLLIQSIHLINTSLIYHHYVLNQSPGPLSMFSNTDEIPPDLVISEEEVIDQFKLLDNTKPPGADGVSPQIAW